MPKTQKLPLPFFILMTALPAALVGAGLWFLGDLAPQCVVDEHERLASPDGHYDLVVFSRSCGETPANVQGALIPRGEQLPEDAASFVSLGVDVDLDPQWVGERELALTVPEGAQAYRQDETVADVTVSYRGAQP